MGLLLLGVSHKRVVRAKDLQLDIEGLLVHDQGCLRLILFLEHISNAAQTQSMAHEY